MPEQVDGGGSERRTGSVGTVHDLIVEQRLANLEMRANFFSAIAKYVSGGSFLTIPAVAAAVIWVSTSLASLNVAINSVKAQAETAQSSLFALQQSSVTIVRDREAQIREIAERAAQQVGDSIRREGLQFQASTASDVAAIIEAARQRFDESNRTMLNDTIRALQYITVPDVCPLGYRSVGVILFGSVSQNADDWRRDGFSVMRYPNSGAPVPLTPYHESWAGTHARICTRAELGASIPAVTPR